MSKLGIVFGKHAAAAAQLLIVQQLSTSQSMQPLAPKAITLYVWPEAGLGNTGS